MATWGAPAATVVDPVGGTLAGATGRYEKRLADLQGVFADADAYARLLAEDPDRLHYFVEDFRREERAGDLIFGTSVLLPGKVGREFHMTRGHVHQLEDRTEIYHCLSGHGILLMERGGEVEAIELTPGTIAYVAGGWLHRSVNVGADQLVTLFCYPADSGQDYSPIERAGGMARLVVESADGGWELVENPRYTGPAA
ncbi:MAG: glucose-6-phosphate isomerase [Actinobacteria bacterium]|nr:glucose-6-phosphate isomerase [Actinomycetota bacterium]